MKILKVLNIAFGALLLTADAIELRHELSHFQIPTALNRLSDHSHNDVVGFIDLSDSEVKVRPRGAEFASSVTFGATAVATLV